MAGKYKTTGCLKFLIFLIFFVPIVYFGASYYHGVNGIEQIKDVLGIESNESSNELEDKKLPNDTYDMTSQKKIEELENKIKELEAELYRKSQEIEKLQSIREN